MTERCDHERMPIPRCDNETAVGTGGRQCLVHQLILAFNAHWLQAAVE